MSRPRVVVVGTGFAGREAVRALARQEVDVVVLDQHNYHTFWPLLYQVAIAGLGSGEIAYPIRAMVRGHPNVRFRMARVTGLDPEKRHVLTDGQPVPYDYVILAAGTRPNYFGLENVERVAYALGGLDDAIALRNHILTCFEEALRETSPQRRRALLTFVIVGGGPTGVELAGALSELLRHPLRRDFPDLSLDEARIVLVEMQDAVLTMYAKPLQAYAGRQLARLGVELMLNASVQDATCEAVHLSDGRTIDTHTLIWSAGIRARLSDSLPFETARGGRIVVTDTLQAPGHPGVFIAGDMAYLAGPDGRPDPQLAPVAMQQGETAARNVLRLLRGQDLQAFRYRDRGSMATIGRASAVANVFGRQVTGFVAWFLWLAIHIMYLMGFRNRLLVLINWAYSYFRYDPGVRLIMGLRRKCEPEADAAA
jgi:NADH dehydrogenase